jgi:hypothetical protein
MDNLLQKVPKSYIKKAQNLLHHIQKYPDTFRWDSTSRIVINGQSVVNSNVLHLICSVVRKYRCNTPGLTQFAKMLKDTNAPNAALGKWMTQPIWEEYEDIEAPNEELNM